jgi:hypothetical protein
VGAAFSRADHQLIGPEDLLRRRRVAWHCVALPCGRDIVGSLHQGTEASQNQPQGGLRSDAVLFSRTR